MSVHTPGPLHAYVIALGQTTPGAAEYGIAHENSGKTLARGIYNKADAELYASAPDMQNALRTIVDYGPQSGMKADSPMLIAARLALAKSEGKS